MSDITTTVALSAQDTVKAFCQAGELAKKFSSAGADYYGGAGRVGRRNYNRTKVEQVRLVSCVPDWYPPDVEPIASPFQSLQVQLAPPL